MQVVALRISNKPNKEFDMPITGSQEVLFWYERTIISLQFFINLIHSKKLSCNFHLASFYLGNSFSFRQSERESTSEFR